VFLSFFEKLTEITFHLLVCQIKSHFFLILFLIFFIRTSVRSVTSAATACISYHILTVFVKHFFKLFSKFFIFLKVFSFCLFSASVSRSRDDSLTILPLYFIIVNSFFDIFLTFLRNFRFLFRFFLKCGDCQELLFQKHLRFYCR